MAFLDGSRCERVAIIGLGQIGCSLGLAVTRAGSSQAVSGYDVNPAAASTAWEMGAVTDLCPTLEAAVRNADIVVLAAPVTQIISLISEVSPLMEPGAILTDVGSAKLQVVEAMDRARGEIGLYVGGHPMAGREGGGPASALPHLLTGCRYVLCPGPRTQRRAVELLESFLLSLQVRPEIMDPGEHDREVAWTSHLPYLVSAALCLALNRAWDGDPARLSLVAGALQDTSRVAASEPGMAGDYCLSNRENLGEAVRSMVTEIERLLELLKAGDREPMRDLLETARAFRSGISFPKAPGGEIS